MNTTSTVIPISENPKEPQQRQTAKELIAANVQSLIEQLEAGKSDALTAYLNAMSRFHNYSFGNILEIARQKPDATRVAGLYAWNQLGRRVIKGQKGIRILAPIIGFRRKKDDEAAKSKDPAAINKPMLVGFRSAYVFDVSQTEGPDLPNMREVSGDTGENHERIVAFIKSQGIELVWSEKIAPALGISYGGRIAILPGQSKAEEFSTLVHELAHEMLHKAERRTTTTKVVKETEAEAVAFVVGKAVGLETGSASADYIQLYHGNASLLAESLEVVQQTSAVILARWSRPSRTRPATTAPRPKLSPMQNWRRWRNENHPRHSHESRRWHHGLHLHIDNPPYMPLVIEAVDESGPCGLPALSVAHYGEQNGDAMRDPEMCFELGFAGGPHLNPFYWRNDYVAVEQWSRFIKDDHYCFHSQLHEQHEAFAKTWDRNLRAQGFAEAFDPQKHRRS